MAECIAAQQAKVTVSNIKDAAAEPLKDFKDQFKTNMNPVSQAMCSWAAPRYSGAGEMADRSLWIAAQVALMGAYIAFNTVLQNKQHEIAKDYESLSKDRWDRFKNNYVPLEKLLLNETSHTPEYKPDYAAARNRAVSATQSAFSWADKTLTNKALLYALCLDSSFLRDTTQARTRDDNINFNYRDEENYARYRSDKRWNRRSDILNLGRGNTATSFSYAQSANTAYGGVASALQQAGNGVAGLLGYLNNRHEIDYPSTFSMASSTGTGGIIMTGGVGTPQTSS